MATTNSIRSRIEKQLHIEGEIWKPVVGYEGVYEVSDHGRVRRVETGLVLSPLIDKKKYKSVNLSVNGHQRMLKVHHLVARAFIGVRQTGMVINHLDNNPSNNRPENLEYTTMAGNVRHAAKQGRIGTYKLQEPQLLQIIELLEQDNPVLKYAEIAKLCSVSTYVVRSISLGERYLARAVGYTGTSRVGSNGKRVHKLTANDIEEIKRLLADGQLRQYEIAQRFNVDQAVVSRIKSDTYDWENRPTTIRKKGGAS